MQAKSLKPICEVKIYNLSNKKICFCSENGGGNPLLTKEGLGEVIQKINQPVIWIGQYVPVNSAR